MNGLAWKLRGSGPPVLLIQGVGVHGDGWNPQAEALSSRFQFLTFDNRGVGKSVPAELPFSLKQMATDALSLMDQQGWESAHIGGHSLGGLIAQELALTAPKRVRGLALLCTFSKGAEAAPLTPSMLWAGMRTRIGSRAARRKAFLELVLPPGPPPEDYDTLAARLAPLFGHDLADQDPAAMKQLSAMRKHDVTPRLRELAGIPTLVVSAQYDRIAPPKLGRKIAAGIPGAQFIEIPNAAHGVPLISPDIVNNLLAKHWAV